MNPLRASYDESLEKYPKDMVRLAHQLVAVHGSGRMAREANGVHLYLPSPEALARDGDRELTRTHMTVNLTLYFDKGVDLCAVCHRYDIPYRVTDLLRMPPLEERGIQPSARRLGARAHDPQYLETDAMGVMVPLHPGTTVPVMTLAPDHPARVFMAYRRYGDAGNMLNCFRQLEAEWCEQYHERFKYPWAAKGFPNTPTQRIILYCRQFGSRIAWQARIPEVETDESGAFVYPPAKGIKWLWHPKEQTWVRKDAYGREFNLIKYLSSYGAVRQQVVYGIDEAIRWNSARPHGSRLVIVTEGPLDTTRMGPPTVALTGKYASEIQIRLLCSFFDIVAVATDSDEAGAKMRLQMDRDLQAKGKRVLHLHPDEGVKDVAESDAAALWARLEAAAGEKFI